MGPVSLFWGACNRPVSAVFAGGFPGFFCSCPDWLKWGIFGEINRPVQSWFLGRLVSYSLIADLGREGKERRVGGPEGIRVRLPVMAGALVSGAFQLRGDEQIRLDEIANPGP
ncbi:MAG: hypothetical protein CVV32_00405 [Methanomicrobiales archaeon HGW-Methanomicrobiales-3]|nr:MAG: hypothetical protein CVV32_00405 [Methanomicrobiales archaeon HGW-Methanomicrobiales-3]